MKRLLMFVVAMAICSVTLFAEDVTKDVKVGSFTKLNVSYCFDVTVELASEEYLTITIDEEYEPFLRVKVKDNVLYVGIDSDKLPKRLSKNNSGKTFKAKIGVRNLDALSMSGATSFYSDDLFESMKFRGNFSGAAKVNKLRVEAQEGKFSVSGASVLNLSGLVSECKVDVSGASKVNMDINSRDTEVDISGASNANIGGEYGEMDVESSGASNCKLAGKANKLKIDGSGACKFKGEEMSATICEVELSGASKAGVTAVEYLEVELSGASRLVYNGDVAKLNVDDKSGGASLKKR